ncbi:hypothetical protein L218DRAFT_945626 [Marasmius fiardii PR-910]|nr:hypothetical protein L218DRAFT_945626 [Marasmius fiardii PR-910]
MFYWLWEGPTDPIIPSRSSSGLIAESLQFLSLAVQLALFRYSGFSIAEVMSMLNSTFEDLHAAANVNEDNNMYPIALLISVDTIFNTVETDHFMLPKNPSWHLLDRTIEFLKEQEGDLGFNYIPIKWIQHITKVYNCNCKAYKADEKATQPKSQVASTSSDKSTAATSDDNVNNNEDNEDELVDEGQPKDKEEEINQEEVFIPQKALCKEKVVPEVVIPCPAQCQAQAAASSIASSSRKHSHADSLAKKVKQEGVKPSSTAEKPAPKPAPKPAILKAFNKAHSPKAIYMSVPRNKFPEAFECAPHAHVDASTQMTTSKHPKEPWFKGKSSQVAGSQPNNAVKIEMADGGFVGGEVASSFVGFQQQLAKIFDNC